MTFLLRPIKCGLRRCSMPRRIRRGFSIAEMALVLIVTAMIMQTGIEIATSHAQKQITQRTASHVSRVADDVETYIDRNYHALLSELSASTGNVVERDWEDLISANLISASEAPVSPDGGDVRLFFTLRGDTVYAVLLSSNGISSTHSPRPDPDTRFAGKIQANAPTSLNGWDFSLDIPEVASLAGESLVGDIGVIRYVSRDVNVDPYLHRIAIPGSPELNRMDAPLDMGGFSIDNATGIDTQSVSVVGNLDVDGTIITNEIQSLTGADIVEMSVSDMNVDNFSVSNATVTGTLDARDINAENIIGNSISVNSATFFRLITDQLIGGIVFAREGNFSEVSAGTMNTNTVNADDVYIRP